MIKNQEKGKRKISKCREEEEHEEGEEVVKEIRDEVGEDGDITLRRLRPPLIY